VFARCKKYAGYDVKQNRQDGIECLTLVFFLHHAMAFIGLIGNIINVSEDT